MINLVPAWEQTSFYYIELSVGMASSLNGKRLVLGALNCQGLKEKVDQQVFSDLADQMDILGVSETWLKDDQMGEDSLPGYKFYPINRKTTKGAARGGVGIFLKREIKKYVKIRYDLSNENFMWCKIKKEYLGYREDLYVCMVYIPPECSSREIRDKKDHFKILEETTAKIDSENIVLMGDFNARTQTTPDTLPKEKEDECLPLNLNFYSRITSERSNQDLTGNKYGLKLIEYCIAGGMNIVNGRTLGDLQGKKTCFEPNGSSTVDYGIVSENMNSKITNFQVLDPSTGSDHCPIKLVLKSHNKTCKKQDIKPLPPTIKWNENTKLAFACKLESEQTMHSIKEIEKLMKQDENIDLVVDKLTDIYSIKISNEKQNKKCKNIPKQQKKWYDKSCDELAKQLKLTAKLLSKTPDSPFLRDSFFKKRKEYKKLIKFKKKEWKQNMIKKLEEIEDKDPKQYWQLISNLREKKSNEADFDTEKFTEFFEKLYSTPKKEKENKVITEFVKKSLENIPESTFEPEFTIDELRTAIKHLKNNKAAGPDRVIAEMLKASTEPIMIVILKIMNKIKTTMQYPSNWAKGITSLLFKEGDDEDPNNYRAITVTDALAKVLAILLNERIGKWSDDNKILKVEQIGFEKKSRPADHLFVLKTITDNYKNKGKKVYACFIDFQKAFDSVWRTGLLYKLIKNGMNLSTIKLIKNMYERTSQSLKINGGISEDIRTYKGVRQGCILSPKLFNLFINDIPNIFDASCKPVNIHGQVNINCLMYADDLVILSESSAGLQACLHRLYKYTQKWELKLNIKKNKKNDFPK